MKVAAAAAAQVAVLNPAGPGGMTKMNNKENMQIAIRNIQREFGDDGKDEVVAGERGCMEWNFSLNLHFELGRC